MKNKDLLISPRFREGDTEKKKKLFKKKGLKQENKKKSKGKNYKKKNFVSRQAF